MATGLASTLEAIDGVGHERAPGFVARVHGCTGDVPAHCGAAKGW